MQLDEIMAQSLLQQSKVAANDSLGLCMFGQTVTNAQAAWFAEQVNAAHGTSLTGDFFLELGRETLKLEREFNRQAGFGAEDDELPAFFYNEPLAPTNRVARFHGGEVHDIWDRLP
jgi:aldehyde:ferredoxin oxidoreductase